MKYRIFGLKDESDNSNSEYYSVGRYELESVGDSLLEAGDEQEARAEFDRCVSGLRANGYAEASFALVADGNPGNSGNSDYWEVVDTDEI